MASQGAAKKRSPGGTGKSDPNSRGPSLLYVAGNTYKCIPDGMAKWNRKGTLKKVHDWTLFVDVIQGDADVIQTVEFHLDGSFQPPLFVCASPVHVVLPDGSRVTRFKTRQQSTGALVPKIRIVGAGGASVEIRHPISLQRGGKRNKSQRFTDSAQAPKKRLTMVPMVENRSFGIELELSCALGSTRETIARSITSHAGVPVEVIQQYRDAHNPVQGWKIVHDGSIVCSRQAPNCSKFELVSPVLQGTPGLQTCNQVLEALRVTSMTDILVNKTMGFHVHISVEGMSLGDLQKICQNYVKYEGAMDLFHPASRRTGSSASKKYFQSCKAAIVATPGSNVLAATNGERHRAIAACTTQEELCKLMNPKGRYYKMNLQNLATGRQPTIEFRQHSATANATKVNAWVRFCMAFVNNSARLPPPKSLKDSRSVHDELQFLFDYVIKDRALQRFLTERMDQLAASGTATTTTHGDEPCCGGCARGSTCETSAGH
ncbi:Putative amidoligase enzyme [Seminavis robusta]|uniref:Amidoligase enzyme n=1 Tax=Seminavis robusta TaxID=568900 RepID=A0A9N8EBE1_9STRA|nr:Putative amidoligase enzyme [Seminavis robusta]|eukprot:Sro899_g217760.1 Putative amidoligase enzyme (489) ;mRNA; r:37498-38964